MHSAEEEGEAGEMDVVMQTAPHDNSGSIKGPEQSPTSAPHGVATWVP